jgi:hypothetical protein
MHFSSSFVAWATLGFPGLAHAGCPYADPSALRPRQEQAGAVPGPEFLKQFTVDDGDKFLTDDFGGPIGDQFSLKAGSRGSTLLEDFIFREKITRFDHERVSVYFILSFSFLTCWLLSTGTSMIPTTEHAVTKQEKYFPA